MLSVLKNDDLSARAELFVGGESLIGPTFHQRTRSRRALYAILAVMLASLIGYIAYTHNVPTEPTSADRAAAEALMRQYKISPYSPVLAHQLETISAVQHAVLATALVTQPIPEGQTRELADVIRVRRGFCFDRSRAIETMLRVAGFKVRHASVYSTRTVKWKPLALLTPRVPSHSLSEVMTDAGWMAIGSNHVWEGVTQAGRVLNLTDLKSVSRTDMRTHPEDSTLVSRRYIVVYGLYSRHGGFYPPFDALPDVNWRELLYNLTN